MAQKLRKFAPKLTIQAFDGIENFPQLISLIKELKPDFCRLSAEIRL
jgi:hypothetical protein